MYQGQPMQKKTIKTPVKKVKRKVIYKYKFREDYNPVYANGAYGGVSSKGEIVINFFNERPALPIEVEHEVIGKTLSEQTVLKPASFGNMHVRFVETGVTLNLETAKAIRDWLENHINQLEGIINANSIKKT